MGADGAARDFGGMRGVTQGEWCQSGKRAAGCNRGTTTQPGKRSAAQGFCFPFGCRPPGKVLVFTPLRVFMRWLPALLIELNAAPLEDWSLKLLWNFEPGVWNFPPPAFSSSLPVP